MKDSTPEASHGCSDVVMENILNHNEDGDIPTLGLGSIVRFRFADDPAIVAFSYPGALPGWGPAVNTRVGYTINFLFPDLPTIDGSKTPVVGETVALASREMITSKSALEIVDKMLNSYLAFGQNVNVSDGRDTATIEVGPLGLTNMKVISDDTSYFHGNMYQRLPLEEDSEAIARILRFNELAGEAPVTILSDEEGQYPIFRTLEKCKFITILTAQFVFDKSGCVAKFWEHDGHGPPTKDLDPTFEFRLPAAAA